MPRLLISILLLLTLSLLYGQQEAITQLEMQLLQQKNDTIKVHTLVRLSNLYEQVDLDKAAQRAKEAEDLAVKLGVSVSLFKAHYTYANVLYQQGQYAKALGSAEKGFKIAKELKKAIYLHECYGLLSNIYNAKGELAKGAAYSLASIELARKTGNKLEEGTSYYTLGNMYFDRFNLSQAKIYYLKAVKIFEDGQHNQELINTYVTLSSCDLPFEESIDYLNKAQNLIKEVGNESQQAYINFKLGTVYGGNNQWEAAISYFQEAASIWEKLKYPKGLLATYNNLASCYAEMGAKDAALLYVQKSSALNKFSKSTVRDSMLQLYFIGEVYGTLGQYDSAYFYFKNYIAIADTLLYEKGSEELTEMEVKYQTAKKEKKIAEQELALLQQERLRNGLFAGTFLLLLSFGLLFQWYQNRQKIKKHKIELALQTEQVEAEKLRTLNQLKSNFFANISHEFRTPLTLIIGPLQDMLKGTFQGDEKHYNKIMLQNGQRLLKLVNQLLDLSKLEAGKMQLKVNEGDIVKFIRPLILSFESMAARKNIRFQTSFPIHATHGFFDRDKLEKIINNLLSNAIKFTPEEGKVTAHVNILDGQLLLSVQDTGIGIPSEQVANIFERFYQADNAADQVLGTGIGLALTKELVEIHRGRIIVESEEGQGALFTITLPIDKAAFLELEIGNQQNEETTAPVLIENSEAVHKKDDSILDEDATSVLIVEDNPDVRTYIKDSIIGNYQLTEAENGKTGLEKAQSLVPDLILTDVMMPEMDGYAFAKAIRTDEVTSHIPIIMLTAKTEQEDRLEGIATGIDVYLTKPFDAQELNLRIQKLIEHRQLLQRKFGEVAALKPAEIVVESMDQQFLKNVIQIVEENMEDEKFSIEDIEKQIGMSRSQLYRKIKALTNQSPSVFIRTMRLHRAKNLLEQRAATVSEIAYQLGFSSLPYFTKCFKEQFGINPSQVKKVG